jgi:hypothetical protein
MAKRGQGEKGEVVVRLDMDGIAWREAAAKRSKGSHRRLFSRRKKKETWGVPVGCAKERGSSEQA